MKFEYKNYRTVITFDTDDKLFYGKIEGISDLISFEAETRDKIEESFHEAVDEYIDFCKEINKEPER